MGYNVKTGQDLADAVLDVAKNYKTLYVMGCFGAPLTAANKKRYTTNHSYNKKPARTKMINAASADTFGFDCVNLIKGILWGWSGDKGKTYGGASYALKGSAPDIGADAMIGKCSGVSTDFSKIEIGEAVWLSGHIGVYIGNGLAVECSPAFANKVQVTAVANIGAKSGYKSRKWTKHGKLPWVTYTKAAQPAETKPAAKPTPAPAKTEPAKTTNGGDTCMVELKVLKNGDKGAPVKALQILLKGFGFSVGIAGVDGQFGTNTRTAVMAFQKAKGLSADGVVGEKTWAKLLK